MPASLYSFGGSIWAAPPRLVLAEKHITEVTLKDVRLDQAENYSPEYLEINPEAQIPVLEVDEKRIISSTDVCEYINSNWGGPKLLPSDETKAKEIREFIARLHESDKDPNFLFFSPSNEADAKSPKRDFIIKWMEARFTHLAEFKKRAPQHSKLYDTKIEEGKRLVNAYEHPDQAGHFFEIVEGSWTATYRFLDEVDKQLGANGGPLLFGSEYTLADAHFTAWLARMIDARQAAIYAGRPNVEKYWIHVQQRESFSITWPKST